MSTNKTFLIFFALLCTSNVFATNYYISSSQGDDNRSVTEAQNANTPWRTLNKLSSISLQPGDQVLLKRGDVFRETYKIKASGSSSAPIVFDAYGTGNEMPHLHGAVEITSWLPTEENPYVYYAQVSTDIINLYDNDQLQTIARYPNAGWFYIDQDSDKSKIQDDDLNHANGYFNDASVKLRTSDWTYEVRKVASFANGTITFDQPTAAKAGTGYGYYLDNLYSLLDVPGEWYYNQNQKTVYYWPVHSESPDINTVEGVAHEVILSVQWGISHVKIQNIAFANGIKGIYVANNNENIEISNYQFTNFTATAIEHHGINGKIVNNKISDCLNRALVSNGAATIIKANEIADIGLKPGYGGDSFGRKNWGYIAFASSGSDSEISYNTIDKVGYIGMEISGENSLTEKNIVKNCLQILNDGSAVAIPFGAKNMTFRNNFLLSSKGDIATKDPESHLIANGFYFGGENNQNIIFENNTSAYHNGSGIHAIDTYKSTIKGNTVYGSSVAMYFLALPGSEGYGTVHDNTISNNIFYSLDQHNYTVNSLSFHNVQDFFGTYDNNYYFNPYSSHTHHFQFNPSSWSYDHFSPTSFKQNTEGDANAKGRFQSLNVFTEKCGGSVGDEHLIKNGNFEANADSWQASGGCGTPSEMMVYESHPQLANGSIRITNPDCFVATVYQDGLSVTKNQFYKLTFKCVGNTSGIVNVNLQNSQWDKIEYLPSQSYIFENEVQTHTYYIKANTSDDNARLVIRNKTKGSQVWIDDVNLVPVQVGYDNPQERSQLFINPSNEQKSFSLNGAYWDLDQNTVSGQIQVPPWSSKILIKQQEACENAPGFEINASESRLSLALSTSLENQISLVKEIGFHDEVTFSIEGLPEGVDAAFFPPSLTGEGTSVLSIFAETDAPWGIYNVTVKGTSDSRVSTAKFTLEVVNPNEVKITNLVPHNQFSPNGDLIDDFWVIENIEQTPNFEVSIFDASGRQVYQKSNYQNDWDGTNNGVALIPSPYVYVIRDENENIVISGVVNLLR